MGNPPPIAVIDSGPLIHLHQIDRLAALEVYAAVHVPDTVWNESSATSRVPEPTLLSLSLVRHTVSSEEVEGVKQLTGATALHRGELEAIALCRKLGVAILLTDDLAARKVATSLQIRPVGSLGVIVRAAVEGRIARAEAEESLLRLHTVSSLFVTPAIVDMAIEQLRLIV